MAKSNEGRMRCLETGCNPEMYGTVSAQEHKLRTGHRVAAWPVRSSLGERKQKIRGRTGVYPTDAELLAADEAKKIAAEEAAVKKAEWEANAPARAVAAEEAKWQRELKREQGKIQHAVDEANRVKRVARKVENYRHWGLDEDFLNTAKEGNQEYGVFSSLERIADDKRKLTTGEPGANKFYSKILKTVIEEERWTTLVIRKVVTVMDKLTDEEIARYKELQDQWTALCTQGEEEGWLEWSQGYSGSELVIAGLKTHRKRQVTRPENPEDYSNRLSRVAEDISREASRRYRQLWETTKEARKYM